MKAILMNAMRQKHALHISWAVIIVAVVSFAGTGCTTVPRISRIDPPAIMPGKSAYAEKDIYLTKFTLRGLSSEDNQEDRETLRKQFITYLLDRGRYRKVIDVTDGQRQMPHDPDVFAMEVDVNFTLKDEFNYVLGFPFIYPCLGYWPVTPRSGVATVEGAVQLIDRNRTVLTEKKWKRNVPFDYVIYGWYRTRPVQDAFKTATEDVFNNIAALEPVASPGRPYEAVRATLVHSDVDEISTLQAKARTGARKKFYAIVIGIEQYRQKLPKADFAIHDAQRVTDYLTKVLGYPEENVITLLNDRSTHVDMVKYFEKWLPNNVEKGGTVFVYYSGHGAPNPKTADAYLVPYDGDPSFINETGYSLKRMYEALEKLPAKEIVVALDSCFSGAGGRSVIAKGARPLVMNLKTAAVRSRNMSVLTAASGDQMSSTYEEKSHGLFTYFLLKGIRNEEVVKTDGSLKIRGLYNYIKPQVESIARKKYNNEQTPQLIVADN